MSRPFLELRGIGKTYPGVTALSDVSLSVAAGEVVGLIGENGAGKSTLMRVLGGVVPPSAGTIRIDETEHEALVVGMSVESSVAEFIGTRLQQDRGGPQKGPEQNVVAFVELLLDHVCQLVPEHFEPVAR